MTTDIQTDTQTTTQTTTQTETPDPPQWAECTGRIPLGGWRKLPPGIVRVYGRGAERSCIAHGIPYCPALVGTDRRGQCIIRGVVVRATDAPRLRAMVAQNRIDYDDTHTLADPALLKRLGEVHVTGWYVGDICRRLGIPYTRAIVGRKRNSLWALVPEYDGVVISAAHEAALRAELDIRARRRKKRAKKGNE